MYAAVTCYNLKRLHHVVAHDMPVPRSLLGAWKEMRETWQRQKTNPEYEFDTPVPSRNTATMMADSDVERDRMAASVGDLATRELAQS